MVLGPHGAAAFLTWCWCDLGGLVAEPRLAFWDSAGYFAGMWGWKGTTIGALCQAESRRLDGAARDLSSGLVRGLSAAFSTVVLFLGFLWIAWDR